MSLSLSNPSVRRLYGLVLSRKQLPQDVRSELDDWDSAIDRGTTPPPELTAWAERLAQRIEASPGSIHPDVIA